MTRLPVNRNIPERLRFERPHCAMPPGVSLVGRFHCRGATMLAPHAHPGVFELCFVAHGMMRYRYGGREIDIRAGELHLCRPGLDHAGANDRLNPCLLYWCEFDPAIVLPPGPCRDYYAGHPDGKLACAAPGGLAGDFEALLAECALEASGERDAAIGWRIGLVLMALARRAAEAAERGGRKGSSRPVERLLRALQSDPEGRRPLAEIVAASGLGASAAYECFRRETGYSPHEYRLHRKIDRARAMLAESDAGVTEIAFACGFSSSQYFATAFGRITGFTPGRWRELHLKNST